MKIYLVVRYERDAYTDIVCAFKDRYLAKLEVNGLNKNNYDTYGYEEVEVMDE